MPRTAAAPGTTPTARARFLGSQNALGTLSRAFSATPLVPDPPPGGSAGMNLLQIANSYTSSVVSSDADGDQVQLVNTVWAVRSFQSQADLYYVLQEADYGVGDPQVLNDWQNSATNFTALQSPPTVLQAGPATTMEATSRTSGVSYTAGGSVGWNATQGLNASVSASVTISNPKTTTVPPVDIANDI